MRRDRIVNIPSLVGRGYAYSLMRAPPYLRTSRSGGREGGEAVLRLQGVQGVGATRGYHTGVAGGATERHIVTNYVCCHRKVIVSVVVMVVLGWY